jgi:ketosteroid isomerase-like protein
MFEAGVRGDLDALDDLVADDFVSYDPSEPGPAHGRAAYRERCGGSALRSRHRGCRRISHCRVQPSRGRYGLTAFRGHAAAL